MTINDIDTNKLFNNTISSNIYTYNIPDAKNCTTCQHSNVCMYREEYNNLLNTIIDAVKDSKYPDIFTPTCNCKHYASNNYTIYSNGINAIPVNYNKEYINKITVGDSSCKLNS